MTPKRFHRLCSILDRRQRDLTVLMDNVHKPHNVSAIVRTADAVGVLDLHVVSPEAGFVPRHDSAKGSGRWVRMVAHHDHETAATTLKNHGMQIVAAHLTDDAVDFRSVDYTRPTALLLGSELDGVAPAAAQWADRFVVIPMMGAVASLNVSVAAAVILYEAQRQRAAAGLYGTNTIDGQRRARLLFEWAYPRLAVFCRDRELDYPRLDDDGEILDPLPRG